MPMMAACDTEKMPMMPTSRLVDSAAIAKICGQDDVAEQERHADQTGRLNLPRNRPSGLSRMKVMKIRNTAAMLQWPGMTTQRHALQHGERDPHDEGAREAADSAGDDRDDRGEQHQHAVVGLQRLVDAGEDAGQRHHRRGDRHHVDIDRARRETADLGELRIGRDRADALAELGVAREGLQADEARKARRDESELRIARASPARTRRSRAASSLVNCWMFERESERDQVLHDRQRAERGDQHDQRRGFAARQPLVEQDLDQRAAERAGYASPITRAGRNGTPFCAANQAA